jgi:hypothetical protein
MPSRTSSSARAAASRFNWSIVTRQPLQNSAGRPESATEPFVGAYLASFAAKEQRFRPLRAFKMALTRTRFVTFVPYPEATTSRASESHVSKSFRKPRFQKPSS